MVGRSIIHVSLFLYAACICVVPVTPNISEVCAVYDKENETLQIIETTWNELVCTCML